MGNQPIDSMPPGPIPNADKLNNENNADSISPENIPTDKKADSISNTDNSSCTTTKTKDTTTTQNKQSDAFSQATPTTSEAQEIIPLTIIWKEEAKEVSITGDFFHWKKYQRMRVDANSKYHYIKMNLSKGTYQFKFCVDGVERLSNDYPMSFNEKVAVNNYIILNNQEKNKTVETQRKLIKAQKEDDKKKLEYNCYYPKRNDVNPNAPHIPFHYTNKFDIDLNSKQNSLGRSKYLIFKEKNLLSENNSFKKILSCPHINL